MSFGAFPGMGAAPGAQPQQSAGGGFVLNIPADPTWEPIETTDTLEMDGYYQFRISREKARLEGKTGVFITFEIMDEDNRGKTVSKFMPNSAATTKDTWFVWRGLFRSITGTLDSARAAFQYIPGMLVNQIAYGRTGQYADDTGAARTGVDAFVTKQEYDDAVAAKRHRWPAKAKNTMGAAGGIGQLPGGLPASFPGMGGMGLPGAPVLPTGMQAAPAPVAAAPMQQGFAAPPQSAAPHALAFTPAQPPAAGFSFPPPAAPTAQAAPAGFSFPTNPELATSAQPAVVAGGFTFPPAPGALSAAPTPPGAAPAGFPFPARA